MSGLPFCEVYTSCYLKYDIQQRQVSRTYFPSAKTMWAVVFSLLVSLDAASGATQCSACVDPQHVPHGYTTKTYHESNEHLENPHRGFVNQLVTHAASFNPLTRNRLDRFRREDGINMIWRTYVLDTFVTSRISDDFLGKVRHDLDILEGASFTVVLRFCYIFEMRAESPYGDASKNMVLQHIEQLAPIFQDYERIITSIEAGFIGAWGEWHHTTYFGEPEWHTPGHDPVTGLMPSAYQDRLEVLTALLHHSPKSIQVQLRYPSQKMHMMGSNPVTFDEVLRGTDRGRTGHHNDCFLSSDKDVGTYKNKTVEYPYLAQETRHLIMGGETCRLTDNHRHECPTALQEMAMFHWTFLNQAFNQDMYAVWKQQGCYEVVHRRLGYRLSLVNAILPDSVRVNDDLCFHLVFTNTGFAAPVKVFNLFFILQASSGEYYAAQIPNVEVRDWQPGLSQTVSTAVRVGQDIPQGQYKVLVALSDRLLGDRADFNILLANTDVPQHTEGLNDLQHTITISGHHSSNTDCPALTHWNAPTRGHYSRTFTGSFN